MAKNNKVVWDEIKKQGLSIDVQVYPNDDGTSTAYVGTVTKDRWFSVMKGKKNFPRSDEALRDSRAVARSISRETGIPLHPSVPPERHKQVSSRTIGRAQLRVMYEMDQRQLQAEWEESPQGKFMFWAVAIVLIFVCIGALFFATWLMSLLSTPSI